MPDLHDVRPGSEYVSVKEAAVRAKLTPRTIYLWIRSGKIGAYGHGHGTRVKMGDVLAPRIPKPPKAHRKKVAKPAAAPPLEMRPRLSDERAIPDRLDSPASSVELAAGMDRALAIGHDNAD